MEGAVARGGGALLLEGARRMGKTTLVKEFAKNEYDDFIYMARCI